MSDLARVGKFEAEIGSVCIVQQLVESFLREGDDINPRGGSPTQWDCPAFV